MPPNEKLLFGLLQRRVCFLPTWRGWLSILFLFALLLFTAGRFSYSFLALNQPIPSEILVVEGWAPDYAITQAATEFRTGKYRTLYVTGGTIEEGSLLSNYNTYAELGATQLRKLGFPEDHLKAVPAPMVRKDRTYQSALALKAWMIEHGGTPKSLNVVSVGTHSRRTHLLFEMAFKGSSQVGIIAATNHDFDPAHWWRYSQGVRSVIDEGLAYLYARLCFHPSTQIEKR